MPDVATAPSLIVSVSIVSLCERVRDLDRELAADPQIAAAIDGPAAGAAEPDREHVGRQALAGAAGVELDAGRAGDRTVGDGHPRPRGAAVRRRGRCARALA